MYFAIHTAFANAACNQLCVLRAEIENQNPMGVDVSGDGRGSGHRCCVQARETSGNRADQRELPTQSFVVIPAEAGIQALSNLCTPASAGATTSLRWRRQLTR
jgi:hypothetical protein